jgi:hypothetical protein
MFWVVWKTGREGAAARGVVGWGKLTASLKQCPDARFRRLTSWAKARICNRRLIAALKALRHPKAALSNAAALETEPTSA